MEITLPYILEIISEPDKQAAALTIFELLETERQKGYDEAIEAIKEHD